MNWKLKAQIMRICSSLPYGHFLYTLIQKQFGNLNDDPWTRVSAQQEMARWLTEEGITIPGSVFFEVGTGHKPVIPICFSLMGAAKFITVDLNRRIDVKLTEGVLNHISSRRELLESEWQEFAPSDILEKRFDMLSQYKDDPGTFLEQAGIVYLAPTDAGATLLPDQSIDCHLSNTVLEHIPRDSLSKIVREAYRLLKDEGVALHFVDLSDHFQHQDPSISSINFLRYSTREWEQIAGNEYAYTNRLRASDYLSIFTESPFTLSRIERYQDYTTQIIQNLPLADHYSNYTQEDIDTVGLRVLLRKRAAK